MKIAVCDDDPLELQKIAELIDAHQPFLNGGEITVNAFRSGGKLLSAIREGGGYDMLILDIVMPGMSGIELAAQIREQDDACRIIFLTSSPEFAVESYKVKAYYYLLKSTMKNELPALLRKAAGDLVHDAASSILVKEKSKWTRINLSRIAYIECVNHTVYFHLRNHETVSSYSTINAYHDVLLSDSQFIKCHKSFIVNMRCVASITGTEFILEGGVAIPISRSLFGQVKNAYFDYFFKGDN